MSMDQKPSIAVIDDDDQRRMIFAEKFRTEGFLVIEALNGKEGLEIIQRFRPNLVFTGILMPEIDGFTMIELLRENSELRNTPVMVNSHLGREEDRKRAEALGATFIFYGVTPVNDVVAKARALLGESPEQAVSTAQQ